MPLVKPHVIWNSNDICPCVFVPVHVYLLPHLHSHSFARDDPRFTYLEQLHCIEVELKDILPN